MLTSCFYALAIGIAVALLAAPVGLVVFWEELGTQGFTGVKVIVWAGFFGLLGLSLLASVLPARHRSEGLGLMVTASDQPELFEALRSVATALGEPMPAEVYVDLRLNASVTEVRKGLRRMPRRIIVIGLPLLAVLTPAELRAVLAHEFGHYVGGDTRFGAWVWRTRVALTRALATFGDDNSSCTEAVLMLAFRAPFLLYAWLFLRLTNAISRHQEFVADAVSARVAGKEAAGQALRRLTACAPAFSAYWHDRLMLDGEPEGVGMSEGFGRFVRAQDVRAQLDSLVATDLSHSSHDPYSSHPTLRERLVRLGVAATADSAAVSPSESALLMVRSVSQLEHVLLDAARWQASSERAAAHAALEPPSPTGVWTCGLCGLAFERGDDAEMHARTDHADVPQARALAALRRRKAGPRQQPLPSAASEGSDQASRSPAPSPPPRSSLESRVSTDSHIPRHEEVAFMRPSPEEAALEVSTEPTLDELSVDRPDAGEEDLRPAAQSELSRMLTEAAGRGVLPASLRGGAPTHDRRPASYVEQGRTAGGLETPLDTVDCTVFAPPTAVAGGSFLVQVFAHAPEQSGIAAALATEFDAAASRRGFTSLEVGVPHGRKLSFELRLAGLMVDDPVQTLVWAGSAQSVQFGVFVPADATAGTVIGTLAVSLATVPIGHVKFKLAVTSDPASARSEPVGEDARRYTSAFISYASADREQVIQRVQLLKILGIRFFQDLLDLAPGDRYERKLETGINDCDLFLLFWSSRAKRSEWVRKEVRWALGRQRGDALAPPEIRPVMLEGPPIPEPWDELRDLHFGDHLLYLMRPADAWASPTDG